MKYVNVESRTYINKTYFFQYYVRVFFIPIFFAVLALALLNKPKKDPTLFGRWQHQNSSSGADRTLFAGSSIFLFSWTSHLHLTWTSHLNGKILTDDCRGRLQFRLTSWTFLVQHGWPATPRRTTAQWSELGPGESKHKTDKTWQKQLTRCFNLF